jgi:threonine dehydratase
VTLADVEAAAGAIRDAVVLTPTTLSRTLSEIAGARVHLKFENLQFTSSFKERGARNFLLGLREEARAAGVVAASAGNHAQGVAYHARLLGIAATIVMPADTPFSKITQTEHHGARIVLDGRDFPAALATAERIAADDGLTLVPAFDDPAIIAGQGTVGLEVLDAVPELDAIVVPVGGGGLIAGIAIAAKGRCPEVEVIGAQVEGYDGMRRALTGAPPPSGGTTIAEGIAVTRPGDLTTAIARELVDDVVVVSDQAIEEAVALALEIEKTVVEGAGAAALAAVLEHRERFAGRDVAIVLSGGNIDLRVLASVVLRALARSGRLIRLRVHVADRPGVLATVAKAIGDLGGNIVDVAHRRDLPGLALKSAMLDVSIETRDAHHADEIVHALETAGLRVERSTSA